MLHRVNRRKYPNLDSEFQRAMYLKEIRLAIDAINVPNPPRLHPMIKAWNWSVKPDKRIAAGTLLIT